MDMSVNEAKAIISYMQNGFLIGLYDDTLDHDAGDFATEGGVLNWLERVQNRFAWPLKFIA